MEIFTLKATLKQLEDHAQALCESLELAPAICANQPGPFETEGRAFSLAKAIYSNFWVDDKAVDGRETPVVIGALEACPQSLLLAYNVNNTKDNLKRQLMAMRERLAGVYHELEAIKHFVVIWLKSGLAGSHCARCIVTSVFCTNVQKALLFHSAPREKA